MQPDDRDKASLWDMLDASQTISRTIQGKTKEEAIQDELFFFAMERLIEIVGEAANRVSNEYQALHPEIPWSEIISMRNFLIHEYSEVDLDEVWDTLMNDISPLIKQLERILPKDLGEK